MSNHSRAHGSDPMEPPFPEEGPVGTVVESLEAIGSSDDDLGPTGEHGAPMAELNSGDLITDDDSGSAPLQEQPLLEEDAPIFGPPPGRRGPARSPRPFDRTLPPERQRPPLLAEESELLMSSAAEELELELEPDQELEAAPTRIEHGDNILGPAEAGPPRLVIIGGNNRGKEHELKPGDNSIGRGIDNDVVLADIAVSRKHTLVCFEGGQFVVRDLGSGNGTLVNGKRVDNHLLQDGDQLELGNTLLRYTAPQGGPTELAALATVVTNRDLLDQVVSAPAPAARKGKAKKQRTVTAERTPTAAAHSPRFNPRTRRLAIFGSVGLVVFLGLLVAVKAIVNAKRKDAVALAQPKPDEILAQEFQEGITEFNAKNWEKARSHFLKVLALAPTQKHVQQYVEQAGAEMVARTALERARARLAALDFGKARQELAKVRGGSTYRKEAEVLSRKLDEQEVTSLISAAQSLKSSGDGAGALQKIREAVALAPQREDLKQLLASLSGGPDRKVAAKQLVQPKVAPKVAKSHKVDPPRRPAPKEANEPREPKEAPAPKVPAGAAKNALALYKKRQWTAAYQAMTEWADSQKGKKQKPAKAMADAIRLVGQSWTRAEASRQPALAMKLYSDALAADARIEKGPHQKELKELLLKTARSQAVTALARRQYPEAYAAVKVAEKHGGKGDPGLQKVLAALQKQAEETFNKAYTLRSSNLAQARRLWQEILRMVPATSPIYQKAYNWLNNSSPNYQDEDED